MNRRFSSALAWVVVLLMIVADASAVGDEGASVEVVRTKGGWSLHRDGVLYDIKGVGGGNDGFTTQRTFSLGSEPAWYELPIDPDGYTDVSTGFGILANGPMPRTILVSTPTWRATPPPDCEGGLNGNFL